MLVGRVSLLSTPDRPESDEAVLCRCASRGEGEGRNGIQVRFMRRPAPTMRRTSKPHREAPYLKLEGGLEGNSKEVLKEGLAGHIEVVVDPMWVRPG